MDDAMKAQALELAQRITKSPSYSVASEDGIAVDDDDPMFRTLIEPYHVNALAALAVAQEAELAELRQSAVRIASGEILRKGMVVYTADGNENIHKLTVEMWNEHTVWCVFKGPLEWYTNPGDLWATREAAEAALKGANNG